MNERPPKVLIVDDVAANLVALEAQLHDLGCEVVCASSGNEALRLLLKREFAVILLDVQMPEMDGFEVARLARQNPSSSLVPIIFVTAMVETEENMLRGYGSGAVDLLFKPVNATILRSKIHVFLELYRSQRRLAAEIEAHKKTLADVEAFNYSVSHDLRAPLRAVEGFSQILLEDHAHVLDDQGKSHLQRVAAAAQRMGQLIDDLLNLSKISRAELRPQTVDVTAIAQSVLDDIRSSAPDREVESVVHPVMSARGDARLLRIVLENLLRNAWKFTRGNVRGRIEVGCKRDEGGAATYYVRDDGVGFDLSHASNLFKPFHRLHSASDFEGTGIGLAIVQRIIHHHRGRVWAEAEPGKGAAFFFTLG
jgi:hypothetical protein